MVGIIQTHGVDTDGDGDTTGESDLSALGGAYTSDGFMIKLDSEGVVERSSRIYSDGYDNVKAVTEQGGLCIVAGTFSAGIDDDLTSSTTTNILSATNMDFGDDSEEDDDTTNTTEILARTATTDAFILAKGSGDAAVPEVSEMTIYNYKKQFKITTEVIKHTEDGVEVDGGDIDGQYGIAVDGVNYTQDGIRYVETVTYNEDSTQTVTITPDAGYLVKTITINGEEYTNYTVNDDGTITIATFNNVTEDIHITVEFSNTVSNIQVNHYLWTEEDGTTTTPVADTEYYTGEVGAEYTTLPKDGIEYVVITNKDYYGELTDEEWEKNGLDPNDYYLPSNANGTYVENETQVINYYYKAKTYTLTVHHYIAGTNEQMPSIDGGTVEDEYTEGYLLGAEYSTSQTSLVDYDIYELVETPENATGTITENTEVIYYYQLITADLSITKVAQEDTSITLSGTEFALYELTCTEHAVGYHDDRLVEEDSDCWTLVNTYTSSSIGKISLEDLEIIDEYRLVETKASENRMIASGEWKIEFIYGDEADNYNNADDMAKDDTIISVNGTLLRVTAVGNPPAMSLSDEGKLLLPNKEYYEIPTSGGLGIKDFYKIGFMVACLGVVILLIRKRVLIIKRKKHYNKRHLG